jgi:apolipoprotein N-acyltransferase
MLNAQEFTRADGGAESVALVQGAVPQAVKWSAAYRDPSIDLYSSLTEPHWGKFLIVWPETAIPAFAEEVPEVIAALNARAAASGTTLLVGMPAGDSSARGRYFNSVVQFGANTGRYDKRHLVPFGEYLPFDRWLRPVLDFLRIPMSNFTPGADAQTLLNADGHVLGVSICYEDAFAGEIARALPAAAILVNVSNDAWFGESIAPHQHLQIARMRALETGRNMLRATNTGISAIIDERGKIITRSKQFVPDVITGVVTPRSGLTPAAEYGILIPLLLCAAMVGVFSFALRRSSGPSDS